MIVNHNLKQTDYSLSKDMVIWDETLRDGEQTPGVSFSLEQKAAIALLLDEIGVGIIDLGFPSVSKGEQAAIKHIISLGLNAKVGVTVRASEEDIDCAISCGVQTVFLFAPTSELHIHFKFGLDREGLRLKVLHAVSYALAKGLEVFFISEDTSRSDLDFIVPLFNDLSQLGVTKIMITDTIGIMLPGSMKSLVTAVREACDPAIQFGIHCHNDFGLATANTLAALEAGVVYPTLTVNGIGERAGNASFEETILALEVVYGHSTGVDTTRMNELSAMVARFSGIPVSPNKPIVGLNAFRHESGIHVHSLLRALETYQPYAPEKVGREREFIVGKHSGRSLIKYLLQQHQLYDPRLVEDIIERVKQGEALQKYEIFDQLSEHYNSYLGITETKVISLAEAFRKEKELAGRSGS